MTMLKYLVATTTLLVATFSGTELILEYRCKQSRINEIYYLITKDLNTKRTIEKEQYIFCSKQSLVKQFFYTSLKVKQSSRHAYEVLYKKKSYLLKFEDGLTH